MNGKYGYRSDCIVGRGFLFDFFREMAAGKRSGTGWSFVYVVQRVREENATGAT